MSSGHAYGEDANLLCRDFGDDLAMDGQPSGLAATEVLTQTPAAANLMSGMSSNPLDDLVSIFGAPAPGLTPNPMSAFGAGFGAPGLSPAALSPPMAQPPAEQPQEDLLGLF